jgi:DNA-binding YbaB/EbfC family protein
MNFNPFDLLKNGPALEQKMAEMEAELRQLTAIGEAGGGLVKITLNGRFECLAIELDPIAVDNRDIAMLQTLIKSAHYDAVSKITQQLKGRLSGLSALKAFTAS